MTPDQLERLAPFAAPPLVPEIEVPGVPVGERFEAFRTRADSHLSNTTPYWAVSWPGGQAVARYILDHPEVVSNRDVWDLGSGNGLVAAAAALAGARSVTAVDVDPNAQMATRLTAERSGVTVLAIDADICQITSDPGAVILAADMWYEAGIGRSVTSVLDRLARDHEILISDANRAYRPRQWVRPIQSYSVPVSLEFESVSVLNVTVSAFEGRHMHQTHPLHAPRI